MKGRRKKYQNLDLEALDAEIDAICVILMDDDIEETSLLPENLEIESNNQEISNSTSVQEHQDYTIQMLRQENRLLLERALKAEELACKYEALEQQLKEKFKFEFK